jgi:site-specific DNA-methyltransferase (adenine-specific)
MNEINLYNCDCYEYAKSLPDKSVDIVLTDPPYLYLKHELDIPFDERIFDEFARIVKPTGFVILFGRGTSFHRWNTRLAERGFIFKESVVWDKGYSSGSIHPLSRVHEDIAIHARADGSINRVKVPYKEMRKLDPEKIVADIGRIKSALGNPKSLADLLDYARNGVVNFNRDEKVRQLIFRAKKNCDRSVSVLRGIMGEGLNEKSIIKEVADRYTSIHPTQKPVKLLIRLLNLLITPETTTIFDPFAGSASTAVAAAELGLNFIGCELNKKYYDLAMKRISEINPKLKLTE